DHIEVKLKGKTQVEVTIDPKGAGKTTQTFNLASVTGHIIVFGLDGNDDIKVQDKITNDAWLFGGKGNDHLHAGGGNSVLVGEAGDDHLEGGKGRDILIGGTGRDHLHADRGHGIRIAGTYRYDNNLARLSNLQT